MQDRVIRGLFPLRDRYNIAISHDSHQTSLETSGLLGLGYGATWHYVIMLGTTPCP
jgi:hypothetical protein